MNAVKRLITCVSTLFARIFRSRNAQGRDAHDKVQLWEGGPYWATTNIGAEKPSDSGLYFWWGDTVGYKRDGETWEASDGLSSNFSFDKGNKVNTQTYDKGPTRLRNEGWVTADNVLSPERDAAHVKWGGNWRMPTAQEFEDLQKKCDWAWGTMNGVNGYTIRGRGDYASVCLFLPCSGAGDKTSLENVGAAGAYWSSIPNINPGHAFAAYALVFRSDFRHRPLDRGRYLGAPIRPVQGFSEK